MWFKVDYLHFSELTVTVFDYPFLYVDCVWTLVTKDVGVSCELSA